MKLAWPVIPTSVALVVACGGGDAGSVASTSPTQTATGGTTSAAGAAGATAGAGTAGATTSGAGGAAGGAGGIAGAGAAGVAGAGAGGSGGSACCAVDADCGDKTLFPCVSGVCKQPVPQKCWADVECPQGSACVGASVCPCGAVCGVADVAGTCKPPAVVDGCKVPGDCELMHATCCGVCGVPIASDERASNVAFTAQHKQAVCAAEPQPTACDPCVQLPNADLAAFCVPDSGEFSTCKVVEITKNAVSACATDADCVVHRAACCDCGTGAADEYVALSKKGLSVYEANLCAPGSGGCLVDCIAQHPAGLTSVCDAATKHCRLSGG